MEPMYLSIQPVETGKRIKQLLSEQNYTIREIQGAFGFENPQAIYKWIAGKSLPSLDNFIILSRLLHTSIENILVIDGYIPHLYTFSVVQHQSHRFQKYFVIRVIPFFRHSSLYSCNSRSAASHLSEISAYSGTSPNI